MNLPSFFSARWAWDPKSLPAPLAKLFGKEMHLWFDGWMQDRLRKRALPWPRETHLLFSICDHYEPLHGGVSYEVGKRRVEVWREQYPKLAEGLRDVNGRPPQHSFFFPGEEYHADFLEPLGELVEQGFGEVEVHLHHDHDTADTLSEKLRDTLEKLGRHGHLSELDGKKVWSFIHGNWALANGRRDGKWCGVDEELEVLYGLGCYADFTFPSAPDPCQPHVVNQIYYPKGDVRKRRAYEDAREVEVGMLSEDRTMMLQGPLCLARKQQKPFFRIEASQIQRSDPPDAARLCSWIDQRVSVKGRPEWIFIKLHSHGAPEKNAELLLGEKMRAFHQTLLSYSDSRSQFRTHYVTARETYNIVRAAMDGHSGSPADYFDYKVPPPPRSKRFAKSA